MHLNLLSIRSEKRFGEWYILLLQYHLTRNLLVDLHYYYY